MLARYLVVGPLLVSGCALSHGRADPVPEAAARTDAGAPTRDASVSADAGEPPLDHPWCAGPGGAVAVEITAGAPARCSDAFAGQLRRVEPAPGGMRVVVDPCFLDGTECPCTVTVRGVGEDVASSIGATYGWVEVQLTPRAILIDEPGPCRCASIGCCPGPLVFYANDGSVELAPYPSSAAEFGIGSTICTDNPCRQAARVRMTVPSSPDALAGASTDAATGETTSAGFIALRVIRAAEVATCGADIETRAAWAAWVLPRPGG